MKGPTKVWKFDEVYSIECVLNTLHQPEIHFKVLITWINGKTRYERAILELCALIDELESLGWTASNCNYQLFGDGDEQGLTQASILGQFESLVEAKALTASAIDRLKENSELL